MKLSILIPTIKRDEILLAELLNALSRQIIPYSEEVQILIDYDEYESIGTKRNKLLSKATGEYVAHFDSDDKPSLHYIGMLMNATQFNCDCASLLGRYYVDGIFDGVFEHSIKYEEWKTTNNEIKYERFPNHLNMIKTDIAKQFKFSEKNHGEDFDWSTLVHQSGLLKIEYKIPEVIYHYYYKTNK